MLDVAEIFIDSSSRLITPTKYWRLADRETGSIWQRWDWQIHH